MNTENTAAKTVLEVKIVNSEHGYDDYDVTGLPMIHRACVSPTIKVGEYFNVYCSHGVKMGAVWRGDVKKSLLAFAQANEKTLHELQGRGLEPVGPDAIHIDDVNGKDRLFVDSARALSFGFQFKSAELSDEAMEMLPQYVAYRGERLKIVPESFVPNHTHGTHELLFRVTSMRNPDEVLSHFFARALTRLSTREAPSLDQPVDIDASSPEPDLKALLSAAVAAKGAYWEALSLLEKAATGGDDFSDRANDAVILLIEGLAAGAPVGAAAPITDQHVEKLVQIVAQYSNADTFQAHALNT